MKVSKLVIIFAVSVLLTLFAQAQSVGGSMGSYNPEFQRGVNREFSGGSDSGGGGSKGAPKGSSSSFSQTPANRNQITAGPSRQSLRDLAGKANESDIFGSSSSKTADSKKESTMFGSSKTADSKKKQSQQLAVSSVAGSTKAADSKFKFIGKTTVGGFGRSPKAVNKLAWHLSAGGGRRVLSKHHHPKRKNTEPKLKAAESCVGASSMHLCTSL
jgi:hypothetical protein